MPSSKSNKSEKDVYHKEQQSIPKLATPKIISTIKGIENRWLHLPPAKNGEQDISQ
jgi:hypothetical protein